MHIHVLGLGSVGLLISHHLRRVLPLSTTITLIHKNKRQATHFLLNGGVVTLEKDHVLSSLKGFQSEVFDESIPQSLNVNGSTYSEALTERDEKFLQPIDSLIVTTKANSAVPAIQRLLPRLSKSSTIVLLHNGMGVYENLIEKVFVNEELRPHIILASNTHGCYCRAQNLAVHAGTGAIQFGIVPDPAGRDFEAGYRDENIPRENRTLRLKDIDDPSLNSAHSRYKSLHDTVSVLTKLDLLSVSWKPISEMQTLLRRKLVVNAVINPLTALMGCRNGDIFHTQAAKRLTSRICREASSVFAAQQIAETQSWLDDLSNQGVDPKLASVGRLPFALRPSNLQAEAMQVAERTKDNISSMLSDIRRGRPTEIDYINGYLLGLGKLYKVEMPANATLLNLVKMRSAIPLDQQM